jgi:uncharacterized LabA/DUF88 family protein
MLQTAIFVDAGYLYAQGAACLGFPKTPRQRLRLNVPIIVSELEAHAKSVEPKGRLLRIYWYDGLPRGGQLNQDQKLLSESANVKCRFGVINSYNQQKGVDSLIVTDLIDLARCHAISDAVILAGDEDIRVGVQVAQGQGIRVQLLGIQPARGSQSPDLLAEADTTKEWGQNLVERWLAVIPEAAPIPIADKGDEADWMARVIAQRIETISSAEALSIAGYATANGNQLPADFDRPSLGLAKQVAGGDLDAKERKTFRARLLDAVRRHATSED